MINCGVPQGSMLGQLLFLLYINDLCNVSKKMFSLLFADDSNMFLSGKDPDDLIRTMNEKMVKVVDWLQINRLSLNLNKTHFILFRLKRVRITLSADNYWCWNWYDRKNKIPWCHNRSISVIPKPHQLYQRVGGSWNRYIKYCTKVNLISALKQCGYYMMLSSIHILHTVLRFGATHTNLIWSHWLNCKSVLLKQLLEPVSMRIPHPHSVCWNCWTSRKFIFIVCSYSCVNTITVFCLHFFGFLYTK